jgi:hypothetical protein
LMVRETGDGPGVNSWTIWKRREDSTPIHLYQVGTVISSVTEAINHLTVTPKGCTI